MTMYVVTRQTTTNGTATDIITVTGTDEAEAVLNAKIKAYRALESFKAESTMESAFVGITDLVGGFRLIENWTKAE